VRGESVGSGSEMCAALPEGVSMCAMCAALPEGVSMCAMCAALPEGVSMCAAPSGSCSPAFSGLLGVAEATSAVLTVSTPLAVLTL
jgi:hypothetical protein